METYFLVIKQKNHLINDASLKTYFEQFKSLITFEKPDENPHYHIIFKSEKTTSALRNAITRKFEVKGGHRTIALCKDIKKSILYILKDETIISNTLLSEQELSECVLEAQSISKLLAIKKEKKLTFWDKIVDDYIPEQHEITPSDSLVILDLYHKSVTFHIMTYLQKQLRNCKRQFKFQLVESYYYGIMNLYYPILSDKVHFAQWSNILHSKHSNYNEL